MLDRNRKLLARYTPVGDLSSASLHAWHCLPKKRDDLETRGNFLKVSGDDDLRRVAAGSFYLNMAVDRDIDHVSHIQASDNTLRGVKTSQFPKELPFDL